MHAQFGICTIVSLNGNGRLVETKMCTFTLESTHFIFNKCPIYNHDGASIKFSTNSHETDYSVLSYKMKKCKFRVDGLNLAGTYVT